jgi:hypothetical protein
MNPSRWIKGDSAVTGQKFLGKELRNFTHGWFQAHIAFRTIEED